MRKSLRQHPDSACEAVTRFEVEIDRPRTDRLSLRYLLVGAIGQLRLPARGEPMRADGLWKHTCFEAFLRAPERASYYEFNVSPSLQWVAYGFNGYRSGMAVANNVDQPRLETRSDNRHFELQASFALDRLPDLPQDAVWRLGVSAVIEESNGRMSYWALAHPPGKPDFHHDDCFALELTPA
jgi:hypothetical protein